MAQQEFWQACSVNCGSRCALRLFVEDGYINHVETDNLPEGCMASSQALGEELDGRCPQMRACARGRSMAFWLSSSDRLNTPLKRVGPRGSGTFVPISWDEALSTIASELKRIVSTYGNEAVYLTYATGLNPAEGSPFERLMNAYGGFLGSYGDYSCAQMQAASRYTFGDDGYYSGSTLGETQRAKLVVFFGNNPGATRLGGGSGAWEFRQAHEAGDFKLICIDPRYPETLSGVEDEWIPLRPGTDAALVAGVLYVLVQENLVDEGFLNRYCVGFDETTMPEGAPAHASYKDYLLGLGADGVAKTPAWSSQITGVPEMRIVQLAHEMAAAAPALYVAQGWGPQRHENGELTSRAIPLLSLALGCVGLPGTNPGLRERFVPFVVPEDRVGVNPVTTKIPVFMWAQAIERGSELTAENAGVQGASRLTTPIKALICHAGNCLTNQHANINRTHDILADESLCEFIVVCDVMMTDSARYGDIVLPDVARAEQANLISSGSADMLRGLVRGADWGAETFERRPALEVCAQLASLLGVKEAFDQLGGTEADLQQWRYQEGRRVDGRLPESPLKTGGDAAAEDDTTPEVTATGWLWRAPYVGDTVGLAAYRRDPQKYPLATPSGKIEIYSQQLAELTEIVERDEDQIISPLPIYAQEREGYGSTLMKEYPYQLIGYHAASHAHSSYANVAELQAVAPHELLMNALDAQREGLRSGMRVLVENQRGALVVTLRVTQLIMPGVLALPQGAWHQADMAGDRIDFGGCINTLTSDRPTPLARGNAQHSILVAVRLFVESRETAGGE